MSQTIVSTVEDLGVSNSSGLVKRLVVVSYGIISYAFGVAGLTWLILAVGGLAPAGISALQIDSTLGAVFINLALVLVFGVQHSVMARSQFKNWLTRHLPHAMERSTYVLMSGVLMALVLSAWQSTPGIMWSIDNSVARIALYAAYGLGWGYLFMAMFVTNHFELMGLRQVYLYFKGKPYSELPFTRKYMYRYSRHPMMLGILIGIWATPVMTLSHFALSLLLTLYIAIGVAFEERDLVARFGSTYREYREQIASLIPKVF